MRNDNQYVFYCGLDNPAYKAAFLENPSFHCNSKNSAKMTGICLVTWREYWHPCFVVWRHFLGVARVQSLLDVCLPVVGRRQMWTPPVLVAISRVFRSHRPGLISSGRQRDLCRQGLEIFQGLDENRRMCIGQQVICTRPCPTNWGLEWATLSNTKWA